jgi:hypothetical protein
MPFVFRTHQRLPVSCPVTYELGNFRGEGTVANLSVSGIRFSTSLLLHSGQEVCSMTINLPNQEKIRVAAGIVRWIGDGNDETHFSTRKFDYGVEVLIADVREKQQLLKFLGLAGMKKRAA